MDELLTFIINEAKTNEFFAGGIGVTAFAGIVVAFKSLPSKILTLIIRLTTTSATFTNDNLTIFNQLLVMFEKKKPILRRASFSALTESKSEGPPMLKIGLGYGSHYYMLGGRPLRVNYRVDTDVKGPLHNGPVERLELKFLSRHPRKIIQSLIKESSVTEKDDYIKLFDGSKGWWARVESIPKRPLNTVFINKDKKDFILDTIYNFQNSKDWCRIKGIPWKLSFLLAGVSGSGKSSLIKAIASELNLSIYFLSLSSIEDDGKLFELLRDVKEGSILLIEDVDRAMGKKKTTTKSEGTAEDGEGGITMSGLLNALDGVMSPQGRIVFMTTNHEDKLDEALIRAGRVDHRLDFDVMDEETRKSMKRHLDIPPETNITGMKASEIEVISKQLRIKKHGK